MCTNFSKKKQKQISNRIQRHNRFVLYWGSVLGSLGGYIYFRLQCYLKTRHQCASYCVRWAEVSMTCTAV